MPLMNSMGALKQQKNVEVPVVFTNYFNNMARVNNGLIWTDTYVGKFFNNGYSIVGGQIETGTTVNSGAVVKTDSYGNILNQITLENPSGNNYFYLYNLFTDTSGYSYLVGGASYSGAVLSTMLIKIDNNLNIIWQKILSHPTYSQSWFIGVINSSNTTYVGGFQQISGVNTGIIGSYDINGNLLYQKILSSTCQNTIGFGIDSSNNYYVLGREISTNRGLQLTKWDTSDTYQWGVRIVPPTGTSSGQSMLTTDTNGNSYVLNLRGSFVYLFKFDTSGTLIWQILFSIGASITTGLTLDSSGNLFVTYLSTDHLTLYVTKLDSSGAIIWANKITKVSGTNFYYVYVKDNISWKNNTLLIGMPSDMTYPVYAWVWSLPDDGTKTGTYTDFIYSTNTMSVSTSSFTVSSISDTSSTLSLTDSTGSITKSAGTITQSVTAL